MFFEYEPVEWESQSSIRGSSKGQPKEGVAPAVRNGRIVNGINESG